MLDTGIRPGEALKLKKEDFNFASFEITIPDNVAKTRKKRTSPLSRGSYKGKIKKAPLSATFGVERYHCFLWF